MLRDVFYYGKKPNIHPREKPAKNLEDAREQATTEHFWIINEFCDYRNFDWDFDFEFLPDDQVWTGEHNNVWPSQHNKDSGTWLCAKKTGGNIIYRQDVPILNRTSNKSDNWVLNYEINETLFDFSWYPDPTDPPYIYAWGCRYFPVTSKPVIEYRVPGATNYKYMEKFVELNKNKNNFKILHDIEEESFDWAWIPDPTHPPYIYTWGNQHYSAEQMPTIEYHVEGATERKYIDKTWHVKLKSKPELFNIFEDCEGLDYTWRPNPGSPPYIYAWGNQWNKPEDKISVQYVVDGATEYKYMIDRVTRKSCKDKWIINQNFNLKDFDFSWEPNPRDPPYVYVFGNQWYDPEIEPTVEYHVIGATEIKYVHDIKAIVLLNKNNWVLLHSIDEKEFDFSWHPNPTDPPYIYVFGNQYYSAEIMPTVEYRVPGATEYKYIPNVVAKIINSRDNWVVPNNLNCADFDFNWIPNPHDPPYIYEFNTQWQKNGGPKYIVPGATEVKYITSDKIKAIPTSENWHIDSNLKIKYFDSSWHPDNTEKPYIYIFGNNQYPGQVMPTVRYVVPGATETKFINNIVAQLDINMNNWLVPNNVDTGSFDFSWVPDPASPPYIYEFATVWNDRGGPIYTVPGATEKKYITNICAKLKPNKENWYINISIDNAGFDFSWVPHPDSPPYVYVFGNQWNTAERESTVEYRVPGATERKYINNIIARVANDKTQFRSLIPIIENEFDYSWRPDPYDQPYIYVFGNTQYSGEIMPTVEYVVPGAKEKKYIDVIKARLAPSMKYWVEKIPIDKNKFDFSWRPNPKDPPYIYVFGSQWNPGNIEPVLEYHVPNSTKYKYVDDIVAVIASNKNNFKILHPIIEDSFDFSWRPNPKDPPYTYVFGNTQYSAEKMPTVEYHVSGATEYKYMSNLKAILKQNYDRFNELIPVDKTSFDYSWTPDPHDPPYIYVWGNQWHGPELEPTIEYRVPGATERKFMELRPRVLPDFDKWRELIKVKRSFDFSWRPDPTSPPYIYVFGNQWNKAEIEPTLEYHVDGATDRKYITDIIAEVATDKTNWIIKDGINVDDFDFSWRPNPGSPPYIYQFGTLMDDNDGPMYIHPKNSGEVVRLLRFSKKNESEFLEIPKYYIITTLEDLINQHDEELFWALNKNINYTNFDFNWRPTIEQARFVHVFGSPEAKETHTYFVNSKLYKQGFTQFNFVTQDAKVESEYLAELFIQPDMFMIDRGNPEAKERFEKLRERFPNIQKTRYLNNWVDTIYRCLAKCNTQLAWILNSELDYNNFDFKYYPNPWQLKMVHVFGTQWSHWGTTYLLNKETFPEDTKYIKIIEHLSNLNFVKNRVAKATNCLYDVYLIDHGNKEIENIKQALLNKVVTKTVNVIPYNQSYLKTFKDILSNINILKEHYIWICSSVCDYNNFDFSYICDPFAKDNLHVFPSDKQKFGDTFLVDVNRLNTLINSMNLLEDYEKINYNNHIRTTRLHPPVFVTNDDTHKNIVKTDFDFPYALFKTIDNENLTINYNEPLCLWTDQTKNIEILSTGGTAIILPKEAKNYINGDELYDYPHITKYSKLINSNPLDIVFLSNGEKNADDNYEHLLKVTKKFRNRVTRVDGVKGRMQAYHAAAEASNTPWLLAVFAKLRINENFDFNWQPDRLQIPKHYIFNAKNPVNGLVYGHQAMLAYNKNLVLKNEGLGLDFTLDDPHEVVDLLSGTAHYNTDPFITWRTAFREVIKLQWDRTEISSKRLEVWATVAEGEFAQYSLDGARDALEYYTSVNGEFEKLRLSYEWDWLKQFFDLKYKPDL